MRHPGLRETVSTFIIRMFICLFIIDVILIGYGIGFAIKSLFNW